MDQLHEFLEAVRNAGIAQGQFRGLLHMLIGRRISLPDETLVSGGMTWRQLAARLKQERWDPEVVRELGLEPRTLAPRDRQKFWYTAISQAGVGSAQASAEADALIEPLRALGFVVGPAPGTAPPAATEEAEE
jgi:hypothetical protein